MRRRLLLNHVVELLQCSIERLELYLNFVSENLGSFRGEERGGVSSVVDHL